MSGFISRPTLRFARHGTPRLIGRWRGAPGALALLGTLSLTGGQASAALVFYDIDDDATPAGGSNADILAPETVTAGVTASNLSLAGMLASTGSDTIFVQGNNAGGTTATDYITFTVAAASPGDTLSLTSVSFEHFYDGTDSGNEDFLWDLQVNIDGGGFVDVGSNPDASYNKASDSGVKTSSVTLAITGASSVEFRLSTYYDPDTLPLEPFASNYYAKTSSITVDGAVVPEPGALALVGLGTLCLLTRRRSTQP